MEMTVFRTKVQRAVSEALGEEYSVELREVQKNNGVILQGLMIRREQENMMPTIYLNSFLKAYEEGVTFADIIRKIVTVYREDAVGKQIDISFFTDFEKVKDRICFRLINRDKNRSFLEKVPYIPVLDLAACFYYAYDGNGVQNGMIPIYNNHMSAWNVTDRELFACAVKNTPKLFPCDIMPMESALEELLEELQADVRQHLAREIPMLILTNAGKTYGACCILYPKVLEQLAERVDGDYYLIPSSVHEFILLLVDQGRSAEELKEMIVEVNSTELTPEEILSDQLYLYSSQERCVKIL